MPLLTALRRLLNTFKLPGEAQKIDRIVQAFADHWFDSNRDGPGDAGGVPLNPFHSSDGAYVLSFSIIMLNTDRHSSQIKPKVSAGPCSCSECSAVCKDPDLFFAPRDGDSGWRPVDG